ncbi:MAG: 1,4-dihydroxy-6-naphthoate synthase [Bacteroidota bacterium]
MKLSLGFSPCPNDTFIFDALVNKKIDTEGLEFETVLEDVETLNEWALKGKLDITKLSFPALFRSLQHYTLLHTGSALGKGAGPVLITDSAQEITEDEINQASIALPGIHTTANLLFSFAYPEATDKKFMIFSAIEDALIKKEIDLGVIIHENRFTYRQKGLYKVKDLGEFWEERMELPLPLGGIAINQSVKRSTALKVNEFIRKSLDFAFKNYPAIPDYVRQHSQEMSEEVMRQHIDLYVNNYSLDLGEDGKQAIESLHEVFLELNNQEADDEDVLFL